MNPLYQQQQPGGGDKGGLEKLLNPAMKPGFQQNTMQDPRMQMALGRPGGASMQGMSPQLLNQMTSTKNRPQQGQAMGGWQRPATPRQMPGQGMKG